MIVSRKRIEQIERDIRDIKQELKYPYLEKSPEGSNGWTLLFDGQYCAYKTTNISTVLNKILKHLNLTISTVPGTNPTIELKEKTNEKDKS